MKAIGMLGAGGAVVTGTGAFTSVEAERDLAVQVSSDSNAFLAIRGTGNANDDYLTGTDGTLGIDLTSENATSGGGTGVNADAVTVIADLFEVQNQGTQAVDIEVSPLTLIETSSGDTLLVMVVPKTAFPSVTVSPGGTETYSLVVDAFPRGTSPDLEIDDTITISGVA